MLNKKVQTVVAASVLSLGLAGCAADGSNDRTVVGAAIGAVAGAVAGHQIDDDKGRYIGAVVGAIAGGAVGNYMDQQQQEFEALLRDEQARGELEIKRISEDAVLIGLASKSSFEVGSADLKAGALPTYGKLADVLQKYKKTIAHVIGHTDSTGSDADNQALSERRSQAVTQYLASAGLDRNRLISEGRGESQPRATNDTAEGRAANRRVDIIVRAIVEGEENRASQRQTYTY